MRRIGFGEGGMRGHIVDALTVEEDGAPVAEAREVVGGSAHGARPSRYRAANSCR